MESRIKGITVILHGTKQTGVDAFNAPVYEKQEVRVDNVLVYPASAEEIVSELQLYGKRAVYELCIPKGDTNDWEDCVVEFFDQKWRTFGFCKQWIEEHMPLDWNKKIKVERYG